MNKCKTKWCHRESTSYKGLRLCTACYAAFKRNGTTKRKRTYELHGMKKTDEYKIWCSIVQRCCNKNSHAWKNYGGRGITMCRRWRLSFSLFYKDMGKRPRGLVIDRIDTNKGYSPENCRWITQEENSQNTIRNTANPEIVRLIRSSKETNSKLSIKFGIDKSQVSRIRNFKAWKNIDSI